MKLAPSLTSQLKAAGYEPPRRHASRAVALPLGPHGRREPVRARTWLVPQLEHDEMFRADPPGGTRPETYSALKNSARDAADGRRARRIRRRHRRHPPRRTATPKDHGALREAREDRQRRACGRPLSLPAERTLNRLPTFEVSEAETRGRARGARAVPAAHERGALDPARLGRASQAKRRRPSLRLTIEATSRQGCSLSDHSVDHMHAQPFRDQRGLSFTFDLDRYIDTQQHLLRLALLDRTELRRSRGSVCRLGPAPKTGSCRIRSSRAACASRAPERTVGTSGPAAIT